MPFCHQAMVTRTGLLKQHGFLTEYTIAADYDLVYRLFNSKRKFHYVPGPLCIFEVHGVSNQHYFKSWQERFRIYKKSGNVSTKRKLFYVNLFIVFLFTLLGYNVLPQKMMLWI